MEPQIRNIVLCFDGTSNEVVSTPTNVLRICRCLCKDAQQIVYYQPGVGTLLDPYALTDAKKWLRKAWDLATGFSLRENVMAGYQFVSHHYRPGDKVYVFGFSRGAYTARAVVGMLNLFGQLRPENENLIPYLWQSYRINIKLRAGKIPADKKLFSNAKTFMRLFSIPRRNAGGLPRDNPVEVEFVGIFDTVSSYLSLMLNPVVALALLYWLLFALKRAPFVITWNHLAWYGLVLVAWNTFRRFYRAPIKFAGVFDTVSAYLELLFNPCFALPLVYCLLLHFKLITYVVPWYIIVLYCLMVLFWVLFRWLPYTADMPNAVHVRHAVAYDEYRAFFPSNHISAVKADHKEVWFAGVHTDVGGGRAEEKAQLAKVSLRWMAGEAAACGVRFDLNSLKAQLKAKPAVQPDAKMQTRLSNLKQTDPRRYALAQRNGYAALAARGASGIWMWVLPGLIPQLRSRREYTGGRRSGEAKDLAKAAAVTEKVEHSGGIRPYWPNFWRFRFIRDGDRIHWSVALRREMGLLENPRLASETAGWGWAQLAEEQVYDKPIDGYTDPTATS